MIANRDQVQDPYFPAREQLLARHAQLRDRVHAFRSLAIVVESFESLQARASMPFAFLPLACAILQALSFHRLVEHQGLLQSVVLAGVGLVQPSCLSSLSTS